jgi:hypothetical protein
VAVCASSSMSSAGTRSTALSQHCLCGARVPKPLAQRTGDCPHFGLHGDRDIVSAAVATCVALTDPDDPRTARVHYRLAHAMRAGLAAEQEWEGSVNRHQHQHHPMLDRPGPAATTRWPLLSKQHPAYLRTDQAPSLDVVEPAENNQPPC